jgi:hypothetical protein
MSKHKQQQLSYQSTCPETAVILDAPAEQEHLDAVFKCVSSLVIQQPTVTLGISIGDAYLSILGSVRGCYCVSISDEKHVRAAIHRQFFAFVFALKIENRRNEPSSFLDTEL